MSEISVLILGFAGWSEHFHQIICLYPSVIQPFRLFRNCQLYHSPRPPIRLRPSPTSFGLWSQYPRRRRDGLRDRIPLEEAVQLGSQFPVLLAGFYYQGWKPAATPTKERSVAAFVDKVKGNLPQGDYPVSIEVLIQGVFQVLALWVTQGEIQDVANMLPKDIQEFWPKEIVAKLNQ